MQHKYTLCIKAEKASYLNSILTAEKSQMRMVHELNICQVVVIVYNDVHIYSILWPCLVRGICW